MSKGYVDHGVVKWTWFGPPDWATPGKQPPAGSPAAQRAAAFVAKLQTLGWSTASVTEDAALPHGQAVFDVILALQAAGLGKAQAEALGMWLGGAVGNLQLAPTATVGGMPIPPLIGVWLAEKAWQILGTDYLDADALVAATNPPQNVGAVLRKLKTDAPNVHAWVLKRALAKALRKQSQTTATAVEAQDKAVVAVMTAAGTLATKVVEIPKALLATAGAGLGLLAFVAQNAVPIAVVAGLGYAWLRWGRAIKRGAP